MSFIKSLISRVKIRKDLFVWCFVLVAMAAIAVADVGQTLQAPDANGGVQTAQDGATQPQNAVVITETKLEPAEGVEAGGDIQSLTFKKETSIRDALRFLQAKYQKNIVPSSKVEGLITFTSLYDVTFEEALNSILGNNFRYDQEGNFIRVYTVEEYKKIKIDEDRLTYKVFTLYYVTAEEVKKLLEPIKSPKGKVESSTAAEKKLTGGSGGSGGSGELSGGGGGDKMAMNEVIVVYDYPENIAKAQDIIAGIDVRPKQVLVEATILSATLTEGMEFGVDFSLIAGVPLTGTAATENLTTDTAISRGTAATVPIQQVGSGASFTGTPVETAGFANMLGSGLKVGIKGPGGITAVLTALETVTDVTIMANPKILAVNKQEGALHIGDRLGYASQTSQTSGGNTTSEIKFLEVGTMLTFRPYIGNDGYIRMDIYPKDSSGSVANGIPNEQTTQLRTNILVKDGDTIVIGGLFRDSVTTGRKQVPLLGDIPVVGALFRSTTDTSTRKEVIVLLTPHIITDAPQTEALARVDDIQRKRFGAKDGVQWIGRARLAEDAYGRAAKYYLEGQKDEALKELNSSLQLRPTYLEAIRLKERITGDKSSEDAAMIERNVVGVVEQKDHDKWLRR